MKSKVYLSAPLHTIEEIKSNKKIAGKLRAIGYEVFNPIEVNDSIKESGESFSFDKIYKVDIENLKSCDIMIANISNDNVAVAAEVGYFLALGKPIIFVDTNWTRVYTRNCMLRGISELEDINELFTEFSHMLNYMKEKKLKNS